MSHFWQRVIDHPILEHLSATLDRWNLLRSFPVQTTVDAAANRFEQFAAHERG